jgi:6-phosphogluconate dehydrogenase
MVNHVVNGSVTVRDSRELHVYWKLITLEEGAGHYVKMVHNGIEYGDMQLISEVSKNDHRMSPLPTKSILGLRHHETWIGSVQQGDG